ncbi:MAG: hypothetical protein HY800_06795, partial [Ignavibacteriales bacterium]|nr:hypothetical protein [Ignavibacteriales bacterium]
MKSFIAVFLITTTFCIAQQRILVSPNNEVIKLEKGESAIEIINQQIEKNSGNHECPTGYWDFPYYTFGNQPDVPQLIYYQSIKQKDFISTWYTVPASGTIDTIFFFMGDLIGARDSCVWITIEQSKIFHSFGPGHTPYPPACIPWGYYISTYSPSGITPFLEWATDTTWISTIGESFPPSQSPAGWQLFGQGVGLGVTARPGINVVNIAGTGLAPILNRGESMLISMRAHGLWSLWEEKITQFGMIKNDFISDTLPSRAWVFYNRPDSLLCGYSNPPKGWWAISNNLPLIWYKMSAKTNIPPYIQRLEGGDVTHTLYSYSQVVTYEIYDCDHEFADSSGVASAFIQWAKAETYGIEFIQ